MDDSKKSTQEKEDLGERGAPCKGDREKKRGKSEGESRWAELVHSLGLQEGSGREGLLTGDPCLATATTKEAKGESL